MKRRLAFATPFVIVAACKPPIEPYESHQVAWVPRDAAVVQPADARPEPPEEVGLDCNSPRMYCNPPHPEFPVRVWPPGPAPAVLARVVDVQDHGDMRIVHLARGSSNRVKKGWRVTFVTSDNKEVRGGGCTIMRVEEQRVWCESSLTAQQLKVIDQARLSPP